MGVDREVCPAYASDRRPELIEANAYFAGIEDISDGGDSEEWNDSAAARVLFLALSFVGGVVAALLVGMLLVRKRWRGGDRLISSSGAPQKAKNSF